MRGSASSGRRAILAECIALACMGTATLGFGACRPDQERPEIGDAVRPVRQDLIAQAEFYVGTDLGPKELVLTFDDGPGPASVTGALSTWLKNRPKPIHATFFVNGACIAATTLTPNNSCETPTDGAASVLAQITNDGHLVANHTTTHRDLVTEVSATDYAKELSETDVEIAPYVPWNRFLFRAPFGSWSSTVHTKLSTTSMNKYVGPIYWNIGGGPTDAVKAADWECWQNNLTTKQCGDRYLTETRALAKGIVLMHDPYGDTANHDIDTGRGNTVDMVKYIVPILENEGFTFKPLYEVPAIAAALPACDASCVTCSGPAANQCTACGAGKYVTGGVCTTCSSCVAGITYQSAACTANTDTVCTPCTTCRAGTEAACTLAADTVCTASNAGGNRPPSPSDPRTDSSSSNTIDNRRTEDSGCSAARVTMAPSRLPALALVGLWLFRRRREGGKTRCAASS